MARRRKKGLPVAGGAAAVIVREAHRAGLSPQRTAELVYAAYKESGLKPGNTNRKSGAAGLFQLLSSGYVNRANRMGGVYNPVANTRAILPDYVNYWRKNPNAAPGAAARDVERSGMGAGWYAPPAGYPSQIARTVPGAGRANVPVPSFSPVPIPGSSPAPQLGGPGRAPVPTVRAQHSKVLAKPGDWGNIPGLAVRQVSARQASTPMQLAIPNDLPGMVKQRAPTVHGSALAPPGALTMPRPSGTVRVPQFGNPRIPAGGGAEPAPNVKGAKAMLTAIAKARSMGLSARENPVVDHVDPVHVKGSDHYNLFPGTHVGAAVDVSGPPAKMRAYFNWARSNVGRLGVKDLFYDPAGYSIDEGRYWGKTIGGHTNHVHLSIKGAKKRRR
jgi:hypothetical protein